MALSQLLSVSVDFDRAAPHGTGHVKAGLNYAMSLHAHEVAHANGFDENMFLDPATRTYVEETGGANFPVCLTKGTAKEVVTPKSDSILPSGHKTFSGICCRALSWIKGYSETC